MKSANLEPNVRYPDRITFPVTRPRHSRGANRRSSVGGSGMPKRCATLYVSTFVSTRWKRLAMGTRFWSSVALHLIVRQISSSSHDCSNYGTTWRMRISARNCETILSN